MTVSKPAALVLVAVLVTAGAAAATPGNAPANSAADDHEQASDYRFDEAADAGDTSKRNDENTTDAGDDGAANTADAADENAQAASSAQARIDDARGPPTDLPEQVPDHVAQIHQLIIDFLSGDLDGILGPNVSDATPDDDGGEATTSSG